MKNDDKKIIVTKPDGAMLSIKAQNVANVFETNDKTYLKVVNGQKNKISTTYVPVIETAHKVRQLIGSLYGVVLWTF